MSIQLMSRCFDQDLPVEGAAQVLLLKLCDLADDDGRCWPGIALLSRSIRREERQVRNLIRQLSAKGLIEVEVGTGPRHTNRYRITLPTRSTEGATGNPNRQPSAGGNPLPVGQSSVDPPAIQRRHPGNPASATPAIAIAPNPSLPIKTPHTPTGGGGVGGSSRQSKGDRRRHLERVLDRLGVASGCRALPRWWAISETNPRAATFEDRIALICWCVFEARAAGRTVNYASDVVGLIDRWRPDDDSEAQGDVDAIPA